MYHLKTFIHVLLTPKGTCLKPQTNKPLCVGPCLQIMLLGGIKLLVELLLEGKQSESENRICHLLGNLSQDPTCCQVSGDDI